MPQRGSLAADLLLRRACIVKRAASGFPLNDTSNTVNTRLPMDTVVHDPGGWFVSPLTDPFNHPGSIILPVAGVYAYFLNVAFAVAAPNNRQIQVHANPVAGATHATVSQSASAIAEQNIVSNAVGGVGTRFGQANILRTRRFDAGDRLCAFVTSLTATTVTGESDVNACTRMGAVLLAP